jgi:hypothetical protein
MDLENNGIKLIVGAPAAGADERVDGGGGETHLSHEFGGSVAKVVEIDPEKLRVDIDRCLAQMKQVFADLERPTIGGWKVEQIGVGLSVSAEGSVGVATAGIEASIEIVFVPEKYAIRK